MSYGSPYVHRKDQTVKQRSKYPGESCGWTHGRACKYVEQMRLCCHTDPRPAKWTIVVRTGSYRLMLQRWSFYIRIQLRSNFCLPSPPRSSMVNK